MQAPVAPVALVVDDEPIVRELLCRLIQTAGFTPIPQENGSAALERCLGNGLERPSLVITDINMPGVDGIEMVRRLRRFWPALPAVFVTGNVQWASRATPLGQVVLKPFDIEAVVGAARQAVLVSALDDALGLTGAPMGNLQVVDSATRALHIVAQRGFGPAFLGFFRTGATGSAACGRALESEGPVVVEDVRTSPVYSTESRKAMLDAEALSCQSTPIMGRGDRVLGVLSTHYRAPHRFALGELDQVDKIAGRTARLLELFEEESLA